MTGRQAVIQSKSKAKITQKKYATSRDQERAKQLTGKAVEYRYIEDFNTAVDELGLRLAAQYEKKKEGKG